MEELSSVDKGDATEAHVLARLKSLGYTVLLPWGDNQRYDLAIDAGDGSIKRIQVKTARRKEDGRIIFETAGNHTNMKQRKIKKYDKSEIDGFIAFLSKNSEMIYVPIEEAPDSHMTLRYEAKQNQPHINWVEDYRFTEKFKL